MRMKKSRVTSLEVIMQFHQLMAFVRVAEQRSFSKAAEILFLSQSTVSTHINSLEKYFGQKVFDRLSKNVTLTPFGQRLFYWAMEIINIREKAMWDLKDWTGKAEGNIIVAASTVPAQYMVPGLIANFIKKFSGINFSVTQKDSLGVANTLASGEADIGMLGEMYYTDKLEYIPIYQEKMVLITPYSTKLDNPVSLFKLMHNNFIFRKVGSGTQAFIEKILDSSGIEASHFKVIGYFDNVQSIKQGVKEGLGFSIISEIAARDYEESKLINSYEIAEMPGTRDFYLAYNKHKTLSPITMEFINFSKQS